MEYRKKYKKPPVKTIQVISTFDGKTRDSECKTVYWPEDVVDIGITGHWRIKEINAEREHGVEINASVLGDTRLLDSPYLVAFDGIRDKIALRHNVSAFSIGLAAAKCGIIPVHGYDYGIVRYLGTNLMKLGYPQVIVPQIGKVKFMNDFRYRLPKSVQRGETLILFILNPRHDGPPVIGSISRMKSYFLAQLCQACVLVSTNRNAEGAELAKMMRKRGKPVYVCRSPLLNKNFEYDFERIGCVMFDEHEAETKMAELKAYLDEQCRA